MANETKLPVKTPDRRPVVQAEDPGRMLVRGAEESLAALRGHVAVLEEGVRKTVSQMARYQAINTQEAVAFLKEPWCILPKSREEWWVTVPKWVGVQVGWLERSTDTFNIFVVNRYSHWLGQVPAELREKLKLPEPVEGKVKDGRLLASREVAGRFKRHLGEGDPKNGFSIVRGHEFNLLADLIEAGSLPFSPKPVAPADLEPNPVLLEELAHPRPYQQEGWNLFLKYGAVIICWPWGMGKTFIGATLIARVKGRHLVVVPTTTLKEQWHRKLSRWVSLAKRDSVTVVTYNSWNKVKDGDWTSVIFDECHRLPANTFSRLATIRAKYRLGLSASPYREDGRTSYIFALTGFPVGVDWTEYHRSGLIQKPRVRVQMVSGWSEKMRITQEEVSSNKGRTLVFCDSISSGKALASRLGCPHVHGGTKNRLGAIDSARVAVVSRVGDEGLSVEGLTKVIEVDFHGSSRRQESQRVGRLFHSDGRGQHLVLMTREEFGKYEDRFLSLEEKGIHVEVLG